VYAFWGRKTAEIVFACDWIELVVPGGGLEIRFWIGSYESLGCRQELLHMYSFQLLSLARCAWRSLGRTSACNKVKISVSAVSNFKYL